MATFQEAYEYAKQNPDSEFARGFADHILSGKADKDITNAGINGDVLKQKLQVRYSTPVDTNNKEKGYTVKDIQSDIKQTGTDVLKSVDTGIEKIRKIDASDASVVRKGLQKIGVGAGAVGSIIGDVTKGAVKAVLPQSGENILKQGVEKVITPIVTSEPIQKLMSNYEKLKQTNPKLAQDIDSALGFTSLATEFIGGGVAKKGAGEAIDLTKQGISKASNIIQKEAQGIGKNIGTKISNNVNKASDSGVAQIVSDIVARVPRAVGKGKEVIANASIRAKNIREATPALKNAIKSDVDQRIINTIDSADDATKKAYKDVVDIASESSDKIGTKTQPTKVGGDLAAQQYALIDKQKKSIGKQLGEETKKLSQNADIEMGDSYSIIDDTLSSQGIMPQYTKKGVKLDFSGSKYTPAERTKIQELYKLATEGGDKLSAKAIREKDQLFSKLKREANFEGVGNIIIDTSEGQRSLFDVFRDIYSSKLDTLSPEIKELNRQYREFSQITDDIEDSIFKTPNFEITKHVDPSEFAKVNLRRIFGESQSSPVYEAIADVMDATSRKLGYEGASPKVVAEFAQEMRKLFPDTIPATGFSGGIKLGIGDIVEKITSVGATNLTDKQKAVKNLLDSYFK
jgi:hypothetical protein